MCAIVVGTYILTLLVRYSLACAGEYCVAIAPCGPNQTEAAANPPLEIPIVYLETCIPYDVKFFLSKESDATTVVVVLWTTVVTHDIGTMQPTPATVNNNPSVPDLPWKNCTMASTEILYRPTSTTGLFSYLTMNSANSILSLSDGILDTTPLNQTYTRVFGDRFKVHVAKFQVNENVRSLDVMVGSMEQSWSTIIPINLDSTNALSSEDMDTVISKYANPDVKYQAINNSTTFVDLTKMCTATQAHIALTTSVSSYAVEWSTRGNCSSQIVKVWANTTCDGSPILSFPSTKYEFTVNRKAYNHVAEITRLQPDTWYSYRVGGTSSPDSEWSKCLRFHSRSSSDEEKEKSLNFLVLGDIGLHNAPTIPYLQMQTARGIYNAAITLGDYAYDLFDGNGTIGDMFMRSMEGVAGSIPYMVIPGNHEGPNVFAEYTERFRNMPSVNGTVTSDNGVAPNNWWYSYDIGLVHVVAINTEIYFTAPPYQVAIPEAQTAQLAWLHDDLLMANENRENVPWIIVTGHRPFHCTSWPKICSNTSAGLMQDQFGELFQQMGVDLYLSGHQHSYERVLPMYNGYIYKGNKNMIVDPKASAFIVAGAGGQIDQYTDAIRMPWFCPEKEWDAARYSAFGYATLEVANRTHLLWRQTITDPLNFLVRDIENRVVDEFWLIQNNHGPFSLDPLQDSN
eukprot:CFRG2173T1